MRLEPLSVLLAVSIHAPAGGATSLTLVNSLSIITFQFTLPRGERLSIAMPKPW